MADPLLEIRNLSVRYAGRPRPVTVVRDVSLQLCAGETLALVGETGCGKSTLALAVLGLLDGMEVSQSGEIRFDSRELRGITEADWRGLRGRDMALIFQDARASLNPVVRVGEQLIESLRAHRRIPRADARAAALAWLKEVGIPDPAYNAGRYPHELSGGMCQRIAIAIALCNKPRLVVADEPTSALDPSLQAQVLDLIERLRREHALTLLWISHDLSLVSGWTDRVAVMYRGTIVESGGTREVFESPAHPYTRGLIESLVTLEHHRETRPIRVLTGPTRGTLVEDRGCVFAPRCPIAEAECWESRPPVREVSPTHGAACLLAEREDRS